MLLKFQKKFAGWKKNTLSRAGRLTLIKSNISGMPNHLMSCFKCPTNMINKMEALRRNFFWGSSSVDPIAWNDICKPKNKGGLGIRLFSCYNKAALSKLGWKILTDPNNLWVKIIKAKYLRNSSFF